MGEYTLPEIPNSGMAVDATTIVWLHNGDMTFRSSPCTQCGQNPNITLPWGELLAVKGPLLDVVPESEPEPEPEATLRVLATSFAVAEGERDA